VKTDNITYFGVERDIPDQSPKWTPTAIVGVPNTVEDGYKILRNALSDGLHDDLRAVPLNPAMLPKVWLPVIRDKLIMDLDNFLIALRIL